jgi:hypothetical protein
LVQNRSPTPGNDHDIAVFAAFKVIEVAVRDACGFPDGELGVPLMRKAFNPETGPLTGGNFLLQFVGGVIEEDYVVLTAANY